VTALALVLAALSPLALPGRLEFRLQAVRAKGFDRPCFMDGSRVGGNLAAGAAEVKSFSHSWGRANFWPSPPKKRPARKPGCGVRGEGDRGRSVQGLTRQPVPIVEKAAGEIAPPATRGKVFF